MRLLHEHGLDYEHEEVREYNLALSRELFERYDMDRLELDFMLDAYCFAPGREQVGLNILTDFVRTVRGLSQEWPAKRRHAIELSVRVPATPETAAGFGLDGVRWAQEGLIDLLVVASYIHSTDFDIPTKLWRGLIGEQGSDVKIAACMEDGAKGVYSGSIYDFSCRIQTVDREIARGFTAPAVDRGADHVYLFNQFYHFSEDDGAQAAYSEEYREYMRTAGNLEAAISKSATPYPDVPGPDRYGLATSASSAGKAESGAGAVPRLHRAAAHQQQSDYPHRSRRDAEDSSDRGLRETEFRPVHRHRGSC
jgi:hypothetical protein